MTIEEIEAAADSNPALRRVLTRIESWATAMELETGVNPLAAPTGGRKRVAPPPSATMVVNGGNGRFTIVITNPPGVTGTLLHEIKSSLTIPIISSNSIITYGPAPDVLGEVLVANETRFFQIRSRYQTSDFNQPQVFGPIFSGALGSAGLSPKNIISTFATPNPIIVQPFTTATIQINASTVVFGTSLIVNYDQGLLLTDLNGAPLGYGTYYVYAADPTFAGGAVDYKATRDISDVTASDDNVFFGAVTLRSIGGGLVFAPGWAGGGAGGTLVTLSDGVTTRIIENLVAGDLILGVESGVPEAVVINPVAVPNVPCFTVTTSSGRSVTVSSDFKLQSGAGGQVAVADIVPGDFINTVDGQVQVTAKAFANLQQVWRLVLSRHGYYSGGGIWCG